MAKARTKAVGGEIPTNVGATDRDAASRRAKPLRRTDGERGRQVLRLFAILRAIENSRLGLTVQQLLEVVEEGCSLRTVYRDIEHLCAAGFPLREKDGAWSIDPDAPKKSIVSTPIRQDEVLALLLSQNLLRPIATVPPFAALGDLRRRLLAHLTPVGRDLIDELAKSFGATVAAPTLLDERGPLVATIQEAVEKEHLLELEYAAPNKPNAKRIVEPYLLWYHSGAVYLAAYCRSAQDYRTFALQRIAAASVVDEAFDRRADFDAVEFVTRGFGAFHGQVHDISVRFTNEVAHLAFEREWHPTQRVESSPDGSALVSFRAAGLPEIAAWVASFGGKVVPLEPAELLSAVKGLHEAGLKAVEGQGRC